VYAPVVPSAVVVPIATPLLNKVTVLSASAVPSIVGVASLVSVVVVVIDGCPGAVVSTDMFSALDAAEIFPASSVAVTVRA
jgi:hypothetical protein